MWTCSVWLLQNLVGQEIHRRNGTQLHRRSKDTLKPWQWGKCCLSLYERRLQQQQNSMDSGCLGGGGGGGGGVGDGGPYVVMEHAPKPQQNIKGDTSF